MFQTAKIFFFTCETSLHAGSGDAEAFIDLPIQRESHTSFPKIESSGLKGSIREVFEEKLGGPNNPVVERLFGKTENSDASSSMGFTDARLLLFPVKSMKGVMAWITCPMVLQKLIKEVNLTNPGNGCILNNQNLLTALNDTTIMSTDYIVVSNNSVILEEFKFNRIDLNLAVSNVPLNQWLADKIFPGKPQNADYWNSLLQSKLVVVSNDVFMQFVRLYTEIVTRNKIDNTTGAIQDGALFTEEYVPEETIFYSIIMASPEFSTSPTRKNAQENFTDFESNLTDIIQVGGNATIGKGIVKIQKMN